MCRSDQLIAYRKTSYWIELPGAYLKLRTDQNAPDLDRYLAEHGDQSWAFITAYNPRSQLMPPTQNRQRLEQMVEDLKRQGYSLLPGVGVGDDGLWPPETSVLVLNISREAAQRLGCEYGQNALLFGTIGQKVELVCCDERDPTEGVNPLQLSSASRDPA